MQHAIDLIPNSQLPNLPHYSLNPTERAELNRQVQELLSKGFVCHSMSPCPLLTPKKDGSWQICVDSKVIYKITIKHGFKMWQIRDETAVSKRFLSWANRILAVIWNAISALDRFFYIATETAF